MASKVTSQLIYFKVHLRSVKDEKNKLIIFKQTFKMWDKNSHTTHFENTKQQHQDKDWTPSPLIPSLKNDYVNNPFNHKTKIIIYLLIKLFECMIEIITSKLTKKNKNT